jgi:polysaccharide export outer membrane protein
MGMHVMKRVASRFAALALMALIAAPALAQGFGALPGPSAMQAPRPLQQQQVSMQQLPMSPQPMQMMQQQPMPGMQVQPSLIADANYRLGSGDKIRVVVYTETDLSGEYLVDGAGLVQLPLLGQMQAAGLTIHDFQAQMVAKFVSEDYLKNPRVSVEVENYRPFYIIGEVKSPGQYPYVSGMNALNAVALAGGFTYRANDSSIYLRRAGETREVKMPADQTTRINPGDIIRIDERLF